MKKIIGAKLAGRILMISMVGLIVMHLLILFQVIPCQMVWGGQIEDTTSLLLFETVALVVTILFLITIGLKIGYIRTQGLKKVAHIGVWIMFIYFVLNIIGNLTSSSAIEIMIFTPITVVLSLLSLRLAVEK